MAKSEDPREQTGRADKEVGIEKNRPDIGIGTIDALNPGAALLGVVETKRQARRPKMPILLGNAQGHEPRKTFQFETFVVFRDAVDDSSPGFLLGEIEGL